MVTGSSLTTAVLGAGNHMVELRERHPNTGATGVVTSLPVTIVSLNSAPTAISLANPQSLIAGFLASGQVVGTLNCTDAEDGNNCTYTTTDSRFAISGNTLQIASG